MFRDGRQRTEGRIQGSHREYGYVLLTCRPRQRPEARIWLSSAAEVPGSAGTSSSVNDNTATLDKAWNVIPDSSSRFALAATASQVAIYNNTFQGRPSYFEHDFDSTAVLLYGNVYDAVVDRNQISRRCAMA